MAAEKAELERIAQEEETLRADAQAYVALLRQRSATLAEDFQRVTGRPLAAAR